MGPYRMSFMAGSCAQKGSDGQAPLPCEACTLVRRGEPFGGAAAPQPHHRLYTHPHSCGVQPLSRW